MRTRVGYTGGSKKNPTYHSLGDHSEAIQIDFDPEVISYEALLGVFWGSHNPCSKSYSVQYKAAVFYADDAQRKVAEKTRDSLRFKRGVVMTEITKAGTFYLAEDYHQKYRLRHADRVEAELTKLYPELRDFVNSTAAMRINAWLAGEGTKEQFEREVDQLGLSEKVRSDLREAVRSRL